MSVNGSNRKALRDLSYAIFYRQDGWKLEFVRVLPTAESLNKEIDQFQGTVIVEDWYGEFITGFKYEGNKIYRVTETDNPTTRIKSSSCVLITSYICTEVRLASGELLSFRCKEVGSRYECTMIADIEPMDDGGGYDPNGPTILSSGIEDPAAKCDPGFVKNINNECVPCPNGDCTECPDDKFRDICGNCVNDVITTPEFIEGRCNAIRKMLTMQNRTKKEVSGFFTIDGRMIILPNGDNLYDKSNNQTRYPETGIATHAFYEENGNFYADYYDDSGNLVTVQIIGHYHTHPYSTDPGQPSDADIDFTKDYFAAIGNFYIVNGNGIYQYDANGKLGSETRNCKKNPEIPNCEN